MRRMLAVLGIAATLLASKPRVAAVTTSATTENPIVSTADYVAAQASLYGVNPALAACIVSHESRWRPDATGDDGNSRGLWQISRIWHPEVTDAAAYSAASSTQWSLARIRAGHVGQWSTYRKYCMGIAVMASLP